MREKWRYTPASFPALSFLFSSFSFPFFPFLSLAFCLSFSCSCSLPFCSSLLLSFLFCLLNLASLKEPSLIVEESIESEVFVIFTTSSSSIVSSLSFSDSPFFYTSLTLLILSGFSFITTLASITTILSVLLSLPFTSMEGGFLYQMDVLSHGAVTLLAPFFFFEALGVAMAPVPVGEFLSTFDTCLLTLLLGFFYYVLTLKTDIEPEFVHAGAVLPEI